METKTVRVLGALAGISCLLIALPILWRSLGLSKNFFLVAGVVSAVAIAILLWILFQYISVGYRDMLTLRQSALEQLRSEYSFLRRVAGAPTKFAYEALAAATDNFCDVIGRGSTGSVFRGVLDDGTQVAVKQLVGGGGDPGAKDDSDYFRSEISVIARVQHMNLVRLLGYCFLPHGRPRYLVYEYVANGSLDSWIFPRKGSARGGDAAGAGNSGAGRCLPWRTRYRVAIDVARGLAYLHHDCRARVLHLDVKPENILLSESFRAVVSDFGLSKVMRKDESRVVTRVRGTRGYLAPEWLLAKGVTEKSDVYSYGMVLFELVGGRRNVAAQAEAEDELPTTYFPRVVAEKAREGRVMEVVDRRIVEEADEKQVKTLVGVALWCVQEAAGLRPSMARVVDMLEGRMGVELPPETDMVIVDVFSTDDVETPLGGGGGDGGGQEGRGDAFLAEVFRSEVQAGAGSSRSTASTVLSGR